MAVAVRHAAAEQRHSRADEWLAIEVFRFCEAAEKVAELLDGKGVIVRELFHVTGIAAVVAELMARLGDSNLGNGKSVTLTTKAEGSHAGHVRLKREHHEVIDRAKVIARHRCCDVAVGAFAIRIGNGR